MAEDLTVMLVHSPLVGPLTWQSAAECLRRKGFRVVVPSLATADGPPYYRGFAEAAARPVLDGAAPVVLAGHSGAGALLPAIAAQIPGDRVRGAIFVDALLPHPGSSWFDTAPGELRERVAGSARAGLLPPWHEWFPPEVLSALLPGRELRERFIAELPTLPVAYLEELAPVTPARPAVRCAYIRLSEGYDEPADEAERRGWWVAREQADHLAMLTRPDTVADLIAEAVEVVGSTGTGARRG